MHVLIVLMPRHRYIPRGKYRLDMCHVANIDWLVARNHADVAYPRAVLIPLGLGARAGMNMHVICTHTVIGMHVLIVLMPRHRYMPRGKH
jgi:hypothetical protein